MDDDRAVSEEKLEEELLDTAAKVREQSGVLVDLLRTISLFETCTDEELDNIVSLVHGLTWNAGDVICEEGEPGNALHIIVSGEARIQVEGRPSRMLEHGDFIGEIALLDKGPHTATGVKTLSIIIKEFRPWLERHPSVAISMLEGLARRIRRSEEMLVREKERADR
jgi:CRP-like cAMP-binding protein